MPQASPVPQSQVAQPSVANPPCPVAPAPLAPAYGSPADDYPPTESRLPIVSAGTPHLQAPTVCYATDAPQASQYQKISKLDISGILTLQDIQANVRTEHPHSDTRATIHFTTNLREVFVLAINSQMVHLDSIRGYPIGFIPTVYNLEQLPDDILWTLIYIYACPSNKFALKDMLATHVGPFHFPHDFDAHTDTKAWFNEYARFTSRFANICRILETTISLKRFKRIPEEDRDKIVMPPFDSSDTYVNILAQIKPDKLREHIFNECHPSLRSRTSTI